MTANQTSAELDPTTYRTLGRTSLRVSPIAFGASPFGDVFGITDPGEGRRAVAQAIDAGINFFDVSPYYGKTLAEERLGAALDGRRSQVLVATKCGRYDVGEFDFSAAKIVRSLDESLGRLRTDYVDLFQVHDVEFGSAQQIIDETLPAMRRLQEQGKVRYIGITGYPLGVLKRIAEEFPVDTILSYCRYSLLNDDLVTKLLSFADEKGVGVINASPLHMGLLTDREPPTWHPASEKTRHASRMAVAYCKTHGLDLSVVALQFALSQSRIATTLVGIADSSQLRNNLRALETQTDPSHLQQIAAILAPVHNHVWPSGRPENDDRVISQGNAVASHIDGGGPSSSGS